LIPIDVLWNPVLIALYPKGQMYTCSYKVDLPHVSNISISAGNLIRHDNPGTIEARVVLRDQFDPSLSI
jgi:hypothetical protein